MVGICVVCFMSLFSFYQNIIKFSGLLNGSVDCVTAIDMAVGGWNWRTNLEYQNGNPSKYDNKLISTLKLDVHAVLASWNETPF